MFDVVTVHERFKNILCIHISSLVFIHGALHPVGKTQQVSIVLSQICVFNYVLYI